MEAYQPVTKRLPLFCDITADDANSEDELSSEYDSEALYLVQNIIGTEKASEAYRSTSLKEGRTSSTVSSGGSSCLNTTQDDDSNSSSDEKSGRSDFSGSEADIEDVSARWLGLNFANN